MSLFAWRMYEYRHRIQIRLMRQRGQALPPQVYSLGILLNMIQRRFGPPPESVAERIRTASEPQLSSWALNILDADALDDVFRE